MPNTTSSKKRLRQSLVRRDRNRAAKSQLRGALRKTREAVQAGKLDDAQALVYSTSRLLDKVASKGIIHTNKASRLKSRLAHLIVTAKKPA
ncbi:MAG: 30S ribosomal protein S20 [Pirellulaceae bacterium]|nr:30S ribosomal protein S20 [Pirellulaceae bacterium]